MKTISIDETEIKLPRLKKAALYKSILTTIEKSNFKLESFNVTCLIDESLLKINQTHLQHDYYTDIITFDLSTQPFIKNIDIYISINRIKENAKNLGEPIELETIRVIGHGLLHCIGYDDKNKKSKEKMTVAENDFVNLYTQLKGTR